ncbi:hypothetical protein H5410_028669 [Solanum commersonii]|uniref:DUF4283 domain-containing protein n=1 Tax=Solanum commersonii TaxID=4109 RepID=A0A9J5Z2R8_SOLCO|nr:hypothetical protein H5410_028669 [Solanum commersonii]
MANPKIVLCWSNKSQNWESPKLKVRLPPRAHEVIDGKAVVIFTNEKHELHAETCRWMVVEKFAKGRPAIDKIRVDFNKVVTLKNNEEDFNNVDSRVDIKLSNESTLAQVWINLLDLPWYYYEWDALCQIVSPIGTPLVMDKATTSKTRPTTAKLRVEIDLDKPVIHEVQKIEYEELPGYCSHCKVEDHYVEKCNQLHPKGQIERNKQQHIKENGESSRNQNLENNAIMSDTQQNQPNCINQSNNRDGWLNVEGRKGRGNTKAKGQTKNKQEDNMEGEQTGTSNSHEKLLERSIPILSMHYKKTMRMKKC